MLVALLLAVLALGLVGFASIIGEDQLPLQISQSNGIIPVSTQAYIADLVERWNTSGLSVGVVKRSESGWDTDFCSYGVATASGDEVTPETMFAIASNSKLFLSLSVGLIISNESLKNELGVDLTWRTKAKDLYALEERGFEWKMMDAEIENGMTIQDMLSHRTGMPRHDFSGGPRAGGVREMMLSLYSLEPSYSLRETFQYNNLMYESLSYLPTLFFNQSYESYIQEHIFDPLNMTGSTYSVALAEQWTADADNDVKLADAFNPHLDDPVFDKNGSKKVTTPYFLRPGDETIWAGAGGVISTARDLTKWVAMLLSWGKHPITNATVVPEGVVKHVATGMSVDSGTVVWPEISPKVYGAGQYRFTYKGHEIIEHGGHNPGYHTVISRFPSDNLGIIVLSNDERAYHFIEIVKWRLAEDLMKLDNSPWEERFKKTEENLLRKSKDAIVPRPDVPLLPRGGFRQMEGTFVHPAYGTLEVCYVPTNAAKSIYSGCDVIVNNHVVERALEELPQKNIPSLVIPFPRFFTTHIILKHFSGNIFNASMIWGNWDSRTKEDYPTEGDDDVVMGLNNRFEVEYTEINGKEGFAFRGNFWGASAMLDTEESGKKEGAEVWFSRR